MILLRHHAADYSGGRHVVTGRRRMDSACLFPVAALSARSARVGVAVFYTRVAVSVLLLFLRRREFSIAVDRLGRFAMHYFNTNHSTFLSRREQAGGAVFFILFHPVCFVHGGGGVSSILDSHIISSGRFRSWPPATRADGGIGLRPLGWCLPDRSGFPFRVSHDRVDHGAPLVSRCPGSAFPVLGAAPGLRSGILHALLDAVRNHFSLRPVGLTVLLPQVRRRGLVSSWHGLNSMLETSLMRAGDSSSDPGICGA